MLTILTGLFGFLSPFLPSVLDHFKRRQDNAHELAMMQMRLQAGAQEHLWKMEEITAQADIAETKELHKPQKSLGIELLGHVEGKPWPVWLPVFYGLALLDWLTGMVRPSITYAMVGFYMAYKWAMFQILTGPRFENTTASALTQLWGEQDWNILVLVLTLWFGARSAKVAFGKK